MDMSSASFPLIPFPSPPQWLFIARTRFPQKNENFKLKLLNDTRDGASSSTMNAITEQIFPSVLQVKKLLSRNWSPLAFCEYQITSNWNAVHAEWNSVFVEGDYKTFSLSEIFGFLLRFLFKWFTSISVKFFRNLRTQSWVEIDFLLLAVFVWLRRNYGGRRKEIQLCCWNEKINTISTFKHLLRTMKSRILVSCWLVLELS